MKYSFVHKKYPKFVYKDFSYKENNGNFNIVFDFQIFPDIFFIQKLKLKI